jgi:hypothetical protein
MMFVYTPADVLHIDLIWSATANPKGFIKAIGTSSVTKEDVFDYTSPASDFLWNPKVGPDIASKMWDVIPLEAINYTQTVADFYHIDVHADIVLTNEGTTTRVGVDTRSGTSSSSFSHGYKTQTNNLVDPVIMFDNPHIINMIVSLFLLSHENNPLRRSEIDNALAYVTNVFVSYILRQSTITGVAFFKDIKLTIDITRKISSERLLRKAFAKLVNTCKFIPATLLHWEFIQNPSYCKKWIPFMFWGSIVPRNSVPTLKSVMPVISTLTKISFRLYDVSPELKDPSNYYGTVGYWFNLVRKPKVTRAELYNELKARLITSNIQSGYPLISRSQWSVTDGTGTNVSPKIDVPTRNAIFDVYAIPDSVVRLKTMLDAIMLVKHSRDTPNW